MDVSRMICSPRSTWLVLKGSNSREYRGVTLYTPHDHGYIAPAFPPSSPVAKMHLLSLSLIVASATALPGGAKEKIMERLNKYNFDVACWGRQNVWDMYRAQEAAMTTCSGAYPTSLPAVIPQVRLYQPLQVTGICAHNCNESIRFNFLSKLCFTTKSTKYYAVQVPYSLASPFQPVAYTHRCQAPRSDL